MKLLRIPDPGLGDIHGISRSYIKIQKHVLVVTGCKLKHAEFLVRRFLWALGGEGDHVLLERVGNQVLSQGVTDDEGVTNREKLDE